ncbi:MAG TPA: DNA-directed RNA polymerase subunit omega [Candidatus Omnitrophota bacterium]|nr:DNA-directed RNA polymerase subunit omega [Candidatus Omnitrophota bacterium]HSA30368.1 DNA-directed RNA polymerase subunit omega [Candidatus Omnitrophota bacterium]
MGHPPIENLLPKSGMSIYKLVRLASVRASELASGRKPLVESPMNTKTATIALEEVRAGMVVCSDVQDQFKPAEQPADVKTATAAEKQK